MIARLRLTITRDVATLCLVIFLADLLSGIVTPTFSIYARDLGVSLALLGMLNTIGGLTQLGASLPLGALSDRFGRPRVLTAGLVCFTFSMLSFALASDTWLLFIGRILFGLAGVATFQIGAARLGDVTTPQQRSFAFGLYATSMGLGFTVGPIIGGQLADRYGPERAYVVGTMIGAAGVLIAHRYIRDTSGRTNRGSQPGTRLWSNLRHIISQPEILLVSFANLLIGLTFTGTITTFFPLYAQQILLTQAAIGTMFSVRAMVSTFGRLPGGIAARWVGSHVIMLGALIVDAGAVFGIARATDPSLLMLLLAMEGLAFGTFLVAGQTFIANHTTIASRGTAVGFYSMVGSVGRAASPFALGVIADRWGVASVFSATGWILIAGIVAFTVGVFASRRLQIDDEQTTSSER